MPHPALVATDHRPYPLPTRPWVLSMRWLDLLFMHWALPPESLRPYLPEGLKLDVYEEQAYLGVVPFMMRDVYPRCTRPVPGLSHFPELNLRTYVTAGGKPGVWFFSLDAVNRVAVRLARAGFELPYYDAAMKYECSDGTVRFESRRTHRGAARATFVGRYGAASDIVKAEPGSLEHFLTERYCLYSADSAGRLLRGEIHHAPWPLQPAWAEVSVNHVADQIGVSLSNETPLLHFAASLDVIAWWPERVA